MGSPGPFRMEGRCLAIPNRIHGTGISTHIWLIFTVTIGKYTMHGSYEITKRFVFRVTMMLGLKHFFARWILHSKIKDSLFDTPSKFSNLKPKHGFLEDDCSFQLGDF